MVVNGIDLCEKSTELVIKALADDSNFDTAEIGTYFSYIDNMSPIEQILSVATDIHNCSHREFEIVLSPQRKIAIRNKIYFVDFMCDFIKVPSGMIALDKPLIIECDGFDYHHTKEQCNNDTARENDIKLQGFPIMRFTGSQIYNTPFLCVSQVKQYVYDLNKEYLREYYGVF